MEIEIKANWRTGKWVAQLRWMREHWLKGEETALVTGLLSWLPGTYTEINLDEPRS